jgi:hypothetical protein
MNWAEILAVYPWLSHILDALKPIVGNLGNLLIDGLRTRQRARDIPTIMRSLTEAQEQAPHATISYSDGPLSITLPGEQPKDLQLPPALEIEYTRAERSYRALSGAVAEAAIDLEGETNFPSEKPAEDWVARWVDNASRVTDETMQQMWGRVLSGEIKKPGSFSLRTQHVLANLAQHEAKAYEPFAKHCVFWKSLGFIPQMQSDFLQDQRIGFGTLRVLAAAGLAAETTVSLTLLQPGEQRGLFQYGKNRMVYVLQKSPPVTAACNCWTLNQAGLELTQLVEREAAPENMDLLVRILRGFGLAPQVGSWEKVDETNSRFIPDEEKGGEDSAK